MQLTVNGDPYRYRGDGSVAAFLKEYGAEGKRLALMINGDLIPSGEWETTQLAEGDRLELLVFAAGG